MTMLKIRTNEETQKLDEIKIRLTEPVYKQRLSSHVVENNTQIDIFNTIKQVKTKHGLTSLDIQAIFQNDIGLTYQQILEDIVAMGKHSIENVTGDVQMTEKVRSALNESVEYIKLRVEQGFEDILLREEAVKQTETVKEEVSTSLDALLSEPTVKTSKINQSVSSEQIVGKPILISTDIEEVKIKPNEVTIGVSDNSTVKTDLTEQSTEQSKTTENNKVDEVIDVKLGQDVKINTTDVPNEKVDNTQKPQNKVENGKISIDIEEYKLLVEKATKYDVISNLVARNEETEVKKSNK